MFLQEVSIIDQIYTILGITRDPVIDIIMMIPAAMLLLIILQDTLGTIFKGLFGGYGG